MAEERWVWVPFEVDKKFDGYRIDRFLAQRLTGYSRSKVQSILSEARVQKKGRTAKANSKVRTGDKIQIAYLRRPEKPLAPGATLPILFEDEDLLIVNKPGDLLSHPTDKIVDHTVLGILRHSRPDLPKLHLLHRLDRETSGVIALAKSVKAARAWTRDMEAHRIRKEYIAIVRGGVSPAEGIIDMPIGREGGEIRVRQWVNVPGAVKAVTSYQLVKRAVIASEAKQSRLWKNGEIATLPSVARDDVVSIVRCFPKTGRLHQIRVHFAAIGHPLLGDPLYTGNGEIYLKMIQSKPTVGRGPQDQPGEPLPQRSAGIWDPDERRAALGFPRVALHAAALTFPHPLSKHECRVEAPLPEDMKCLISDKLKAP